MIINKSDKLLVIIGPSGTGKSSVVRTLIEAAVIELTPSWTTRPLRQDEQGGDPEHVFCTDEEFSRKEQAKYFLEVVSPFGLPYKYGMPSIERTNRELIPAIMLRAPMLKLLSAHYSNPVIYQIEAPKQHIEEVLNKRQSSGDNLGTRLDDYEREIELGKQLATRVFINNELAATVEAIRRSLQDDFSGSARPTAL